MFSKFLLTMLFVFSAMILILWGSILAYIFRHSLVYSTSDIFYLIFAFMLLSIPVITVRHGIKQLVIKYQLLWCTKLLQQYLGIADKIKIKFYSDYEYGASWEWLEVIFPLAVSEQQFSAISSKMKEWDIQVKLGSQWKMHNSSSLNFKGIYKEMSKEQVLEHIKQAHQKAMQEYDNILTFHGIKLKALYQRLKNASNSSS